MTTCGDNGGLTRSGTRCQRQVRGGARCAQHGRDAAGAADPAVPSGDERDFKLLVGGAAGAVLTCVYFGANHLFGGTIALIAVAGVVVLLGAVVWSLQRCLRVGVSPLQLPVVVTLLLFMCGAAILLVSVMDSAAARSFGRGWGLPTNAEYDAKALRARRLDYIVAVHQDPRLLLDLHVNRTVESALRGLAGVPDIEYVVVFGARGCGKTQAVLGATEGVAGVLRVRASNTNDVLTRLIAAELPGDATDMRLDDLSRLLAAAGERLNETDANARVPTIVVEVESGTRRDVVYNLFHEIKVLNSDSEVCRVIAVLNDATAVYSLPPDPDRQLEVFVDDFTEAEARDMLKKLGVANETRCAALIKAVGTRASSLAAVVKLQDDAEALRAYVAQREEEAYQQLLRLSNDRELGGTVTTVYAQIDGSSSHPRPCTLASLSGAAAVFKDAAAMAKLMKARDAHVLLYHPAEDAYRFLTVFHERAVARVLAEAATYRYR